MGSREDFQECKVQDVTGRSKEGTRNTSKNCSLCLLQLHGGLGFAKLIKDKFLQNIQHFSLLSFCKILQKRIFSFLYLYLYYLHLKEQRQHKNTNLIEEQHVNYFQPCQESLELKAGASSVTSFDDSFFLASAFLLCS